jgi:geranylgeranyl transferase type-2 subunit alpha
MHGRAKVKTTAEQEEAKKREREKKANAYKEATSKIYLKRSLGEYDDKSLKLTEAVLRPNPEILTLWNYRREIFQKKMKDIPESEVQKYLEAELSFLEACLRVNPKAYGIWLHREWVMLNIPNPNWKREQELCNLFLKYDERNFHCWDYRRFAIQHSGVSNEEELAFTSAKIADNFSNYSAWHYRSKLLPLVDAKESGQLSKEVSDRGY